MPSTLALGLGLVDGSQETTGGENPQDNAQWVTDAGVEIITDAGDNVINNGEQ